MAEFKAGDKVTLKSSGDQGVVECASFTRPGLLIVLFEDSGSVCYVDPGSLSPFPCTIFVFVRRGSACENVQVAVVSASTQGEAEMLFDRGTLSLSQFYDISEAGKTKAAAGILFRI